MLSATQHILRIAEAHAEAGGIDLGVIVKLRLKDDMHIQLSGREYLAPLLQRTSRDARWFV